MELSEIQYHNNEKNLLIINSILENLESINDELIEYGITLKNQQIIFDLKKINQKSLAVQKNINGMTFIVSKTPFKEYSPEIILLKNNKKVHTKKFGYPKKIDSLFPTKDILINVFKFIGIKLYKNKKNDKIEKDFDIIFEKFKNFNINSISCFKQLKEKTKIINDHKEILLQTDQMFKDFLISYDIAYESIQNGISHFKEQYENYKKVTNENINNIETQINETENQILKKKLLDAKNNNIIFLKKVECIYILSIEYLKKYEIQKIKNEYKNMLIKFRQILNIIYLENINMNKDFIIDNIEFEEILFSEIFKLKTEKQETSPKFDVLKQNYIYHARRTKELLKTPNNIISFINKIDDYLKIII